jgi:hypothetical protein
MLFGGGLVLSIILLVVVYLLGGRAAVELAVDVVRPPLVALARFAGDAIRDLGRNLRDGASYTSKSTKAVLFLVTCCAVVAAVVYFPTKRAAETRGAKAADVRTWKHIRKNYTLKNKPKKPAQWAPSIFGYGAK